MGTALAETTDITKITESTLTNMIKDELGFNREAKMFEKKVEAASNPEQYFEKRKGRQGELANTIAKFVKTYAEKLREAGFTPEEIGIISRHVARVLGDIVKLQLEAEYPTEFARRGLEDLLKRKYR